MTSNANKLVLAKTDLPRNERGRWVGALSLRRIVPVCVAGADHCGTMHDRQNVDFAADALVHDAIGTAEGLAERGRLVVMAFTGEDFKGIVDDSKDDAVGLVDADTPPAAQVVAQRFGVADAGCAVAVDALEKLVDALERLGILTLPGKVLLPGILVPDLTHGRDPRRQSSRVRSCCDRHPCRGRGVPAHGCWIRCRTDRQELQRAVCRVGRTAERKP